jgi:hypothetical protein
MVRKLASGLLLACFFATLVLAARHNHFLDRADDGTEAACILCSGAIATSPPLPVLEQAPQPAFRRIAAAPAVPAIPYLLKLDHSGGAPPLPA